MLRFLSKHPSVANYDLTSLKEVLCGAAPLSDENAKQCSDRLGATVRQGYGMTELTIACVLRR